jgi:hypothetical protein
MKHYNLFTRRIEAVFTHQAKSNHSMSRTLTVVQRSKKTKRESQYAKMVVPQMFRSPIGRFHHLLPGSNSYNADTATFPGDEEQTSVPRHSLRRSRSVDGLSQRASLAGLFETLTSFTPDIYIRFKTIQPHLSATAASRCM